MNTRKCQKKILAAVTKAAKKMRIGSMKSGVRITKTMKARYQAAIKPIAKKAMAMCSMTAARRAKTAKKIFSSMVKRL
jgi:hypothetical protein